MALVLLFFIPAAALKIIVVAGQGVLPHQGEKIADKAVIFFATLGILFFTRWLIVDAPLSFLKRFTIIPLLKTLISLILYFIAAIYLLHRMAGIDLTPLLTTSAVLTGIIALSLQETLKNLFTGIWINTERVVAKGDWVNIAGKDGRVMDVTWRTTRLLTFTNDYVYFPNKVLSEGHVDNYTYPSPLHVVEIDVGAAYKHPPNRVKDVLLQAASENHHVLKEPCPEVYLTTFGDFSIQYRLRTWINDYGSILKVKSDLHYSIWYAFRRNNIEIPFPIRTIYRHKTEAKSAAPAEMEVYLRKVDFLKPLKDTDIEKISNTARLEIYGENEIIFRQGDKGDTCYFIKQGNIDIILKDDRGNDNVVATLAPGDFFGEMSLLTGEERKTTAAAKTDTELIAIGSIGFSDVFENNPDVMEKLSGIVAMRSFKLEEARKKAMTETEMIEEQKNESQAVLDKIRAFFKIGR
ncbi:MAG: mechanosensitive ion channel [Deltaproteobacteria bacterium]|nr:mechanosensitive ion channel [Deltaproteobacteria bacterium]